MFNEQVEVLQKYCNKALDVDAYFTGDLKDIDYLKIFFKAAENKNTHPFAGSEMALLKTEFNGEDHLMMVFAISLYAEDDENKDGGGSVKMKQVSEKMTNIVKRVEAAFITFDYINCKTVREEHHKYEYITILKKVSDILEDEDDDE